MPIEQPDYPAPSESRSSCGDGQEIPSQEFRDAYAHALRPLHNLWFDPSPKYEGYGVAHMGSPKGTLTGKAELTVDSGGEASVVLNYTEFQCDIEGLSHTDFIWGRSSSEGPITERTRFNPCERFVIEDERGTFESHGKVMTGGRTIPISGDPSKPVTVPLPFSHVQGVFRTKQSVGKPKYWVLPLGNFLCTTRLWYTDLEQHPLRLRFRPIPPAWLSATDMALFNFNAMGTNSIVAFEHREKPVFIELLDDYPERKESLKARSIRSTLTAVMVGEVDESLPETGKENDWEMVRLTAALSIVSGTDIFVPWMELRDESGRLIERRHIRFYQPEFRAGIPHIDEWISGSTGYFLAKVLTSDALQDGELRAVFDLVRAASDLMISLEERLVFIFRALDHLCDKYETRAPWKPEDTLRSETAAEIRKLLTDCRANIRAISRREHASYKPRELARIERVADRVAEAPVLHSSFGGAVLALFEKFKIQDFARIEQHLSCLAPQGKVVRLLERLRGEVVHTAHLRLGADSPYKVRDAHAIGRHLGDILVRLLFKIVGYDGPYSPATVFAYGSATQEWPSKANLLEQFAYVPVSEEFKGGFTFASFTPNKLTDKERDVLASAGLRVGKPQDEQSKTNAQESVKSEQAADGNTTKSASFESPAKPES